MSKKIILPIMSVLLIATLFSGCDRAETSTGRETGLSTESEINVVSESEKSTVKESSPDLIPETESETETAAETQSESFTESDTQNEPETDTESESIRISENHAPDFIMLDGNGNYVDLSDFFGKPIVLNFWASWCPPCKAEMPDFEKEYKNNPDVQFMMLNCTYHDTMEDANKFIADSGYTFTVFYDTLGIGVSTYGISGFPTTFFIAANGEIVTYKVGMLTAEELEYGLSLIK